MIIFEYRKEKEMKSKNQIRMDFSRAYAEAERLDRTAEKLKTLAAKKMEQSMMSLSYAWTGANARQFLQKESQLQKNIEGTARELYQVAADIRMIARRVYEAEMRAYEIAARRTSG